MRYAFLLLVAFSTFVATSHKVPAEQSASSSDRTAEVPTILEKNEGEPRVRRPRSIPMASNQFMLKIDRRNGRSNHFVVGTETMAPGALIPRHRHLGEDEILLIGTGTAHVWLGDKESDVHAGGMVFIPAGTWISAKNTGKEPLELTFVFAQLGFDEYLRCTSVPAGHQVSGLSDDDYQECQHKGHAVFEAAK